MIGLGKTVPVLFRINTLRQEGIMGDILGILGMNSAGMSVSHDFVMTFMGTPT